jgi:RNA polymerase sigma-70 factor (ECF subfamily)
MDPPTDEILLTRFRRGDQSALAELARRYERPLLGLANAVLGGRSDLARDAVQETWVRVIRFAGSFSARSSFKTWIYRITLNQCRTLAVKSKRPSAGPPDDAHAPLPDPAAADDKAWLRTQLQSFPPDRRLLLLLCYHDGMTHQTVAEILGIPVGTVKSRLHAALIDLRQRLATESTV